jgi:hypothetical protein
MWTSRKEVRGGWKKLHEELHNLWNTKAVWRWPKLHPAKRIIQTAVQKQSRPVHCRVIPASHPTHESNSPLLRGHCYTAAAQKLCDWDVCRIYELNVCLLSKITSHPNRLLLLVEHLAMCSRKRKCRVRKRRTDW